MVMMVCPDCGRQVSSEAALCLGCGRKRRMGKWAKVAIAAAIGLLAVVAFAATWVALRHDEGARRDSDTPGDRYKL